MSDERNGDIQLAIPGMLLTCASLFPYLNKAYTIDDPLELMLELAKEKLVNAAGDVIADGAGLSKFREKVLKAAKMPSLTYSQLMAVIKGISDFADTLQKKTLLTPSSPPSSASSQPEMTASGTTSTFQESVRKISST